MPKFVEKLEESKAKGKKQSKEPAPPKERKVIYPELKGKVGWLTAEQARTFLGWKQSDNTDKPYTEFLLKDRNGVATKCFNVEKQRPFYMATALQWMGEILGGHWNGDGGEANGESIIISRTALVIDGKHRLIGLVLAEQEWLNNPDKYHHWGEEPKIHCFINIGVREDIQSINTINTGKPRSLADAIYASGLFGDMDASRSKDKRKLKMLSRMADYAVRLLWQRTGASENAFAPRRTHAESLDFIQRHPKLLECVRHIYEENGNDDKLKYYPSPGYAAALLYLMGSSNSERENSEGTGYIQADCPTEDLLNWDMWDKACGFWTAIASGDKSMKLLIQAVSELMDSAGGSFLQERVALIVQSWWKFAENKKLVEEDVTLDLIKDQDGVERLAACPTVGEVFGDLMGIDIGSLDKSQG
jgi:hypothetical protein